MKNQPSSYPYRIHNVIEYDDNDYEEDDEDNPDQIFNQNAYYDDAKRHPKKRKLDSFVSKNEFAPPREIWSEEEIVVLFEVWGERYMELGRRSLRAEDWTEVTEKVTELSGIERTEVECRSQLDILKNKYKKEMAKAESGFDSKWGLFKKMDGLLNMRARGPCGLGCGIDSGEYVFMNPRVYLDRSNVLDEMRDSPEHSDEENDEDNEEVNGESARLLAESIQRFGEIYEKIEETKRNQMVELEKMKQDFQRDLELQKKQIVERAQAEIAKIRELDGDTDASSENLGD